MNINEFVHLRGREKKITRRTVLKTAAAAPIALALGAVKALGQTSQRPNIIFIMADDLGYADLSTYGRREYLTPSIDSLATDGMKFLQFYANSSVCSATRTALITGRYQYRLPLGLEEPLAANDRSVGLPPEHPTLPSILQQAGYTTALIGKWHLGHLPDYGPLKSGYDHFWGLHTGGVDYFTHDSTDTTHDLWDDDVEIEATGYLTQLLGDQAVEWITATAPREGPYFLSLHFTAPHWPWEGPDDQAESARLDALGARAIFHYDGGDMETYAQMVTELDRQVGRVLEALEATGQAESTIVVFTSDNGGERFSDTWPFTGKKQELLEGGLRVPCLVRWPGRIPAREETDQVAITMDWFPTLLAAAGTAPDPAYSVDGMNLLPQVTAGAAPVSRRLYWRYNSNAQRAVRDGDMKFLKIRDNTFLFNVAADPLERGNLKEREPEVYARLSAAFAEWNAQMLPEEPYIGGGNTPDVLADHFGNTNSD
jgi:arylsulfatase A-like enzyme